MGSPQLLQQALGSTVGSFALQYPPDISCFSAISSTVLHLLIFSCSSLLIHILPQWVSSGFSPVAVAQGAAALGALTCSRCPWGRHTSAGLRCSSPQEHVGVPCPCGCCTGVQTAEQKVCILLGGVCLGCCRSVTAVLGLAGNSSDQTRATHIHSHLLIPKLGEPAVNV